MLQHSHHLGNAFSFSFLWSLYPSIHGQATPVAFGIFPPVKTAATLNDFYSTNIFKVYWVAKHIADLKIDSRLDARDATLVNEIAMVTYESGKTRNEYSFATKYCSHHYPNDFPIYDDYIKKVLEYFRDVDGFCGFNTPELLQYPRFKEILCSFRQFYKLEQFSLKQLDQYLWQLGKLKFPKQY